MQNCRAFIISFYFYSQKQNLSVKYNLESPLFKKGGVIVTDDNIIHFETETTYQVDKMKFIVNSHFKDEGETIDKILLRLVERDVDEMIHW